MASKSKIGQFRWPMLIFVLVGIGLLGWVILLTFQTHALQARLNEKSSVAAARVALAKQGKLNSNFNQSENEFMGVQVLRMVSTSRNRHDFPVRSGEYIVSRLDNPEMMLPYESIESANVDATLYVPAGEHRLRITALWADSTEASSVWGRLRSEDLTVGLWRDVLNKSIDGDQVYDIAIRFRKGAPEDSATRPGKVASEHVECFLNDEKVATLFECPPITKPVTTFHAKKAKHQRYQLLQRPNELVGPRKSLPMTRIVGGYYLGPRLSRKSFAYMVWLESTTRPGMQMERILANQHYFDGVFKGLSLSEVFEEPRSDGYYFFRPGMLATPEEK